MSCTCALCLDDVRDARLLPCLHSFCRSCIDQLSVTASPDALMACPSCGTPFQLPRDCTAARREEKRARCETCWKEDGESRTPDVWCSECEVSVCSKHVASHVLAPGKHPIMAIGHSHSLSEASATPGTAPGSACCSEHGEALKYLCKTCDALVCGDCTTLGAHKDPRSHDVVRVSSVMAEKKRTSMAEVEKLTDVVRPKLERAISGVDDVSQELFAEARDLRSKIQAATQSAVRTVEAYGQQLLQEVDDEEDARHKLLDMQRDELKRQLDSVSNAVTFGLRLGTQDSEDDMFSLFVALEERAKALNSTKIAAKPRERTKMCFNMPSEDEALRSAKSAVGSVHLGRASARRCRLVARQEVVENKTSVQFIVEAGDDNNQTKTTGGDLVSVRCVSSPFGGETISLKVEDEHNGTYVVTARPMKEGEYSLEVRVNGESLPQPAIFTHGTRHLRFIFDQSACHPDIELSADRKGAEKVRFGRSSVLGNVGMRRGRHSWTIQIGKANIYFILGVASKPFSCGGSSYRHSQSFQSNGSSVYTTGGALSDPTIRLSCFDDNESLRLVLDCEARYLWIRNIRTNESAVITNLPDEEYFPYVYIGGVECRVKVLE